MFRTGAKTRPYTNVTEVPFCLRDFCHLISYFGSRYDNAGPVCFG